MREEVDVWDEEGGFGVFVGHVKEVMKCCCQSLLSSEIRSI